MKKLHPEIKKFWEEQGKVIMINEESYQTYYCAKLSNGDLPIAQIPKFEDGNPDMYWFTDNVNESPLTEEIAIRYIKLKIFW